MAHRRGKGYVRAGRIELRYVGTRNGRGESTRDGPRQVVVGQVQVGQPGRLHELRRNRPGQDIVVQVEVVQKLAGAEVGRDGAIELVVLEPKCDEVREVAADIGWQRTREGIVREVDCLQIGAVLEHRRPCTRELVSGQEQFVNRGCQIAETLHA